jgi:hypothetical protein
MDVPMDAHTLRAIRAPLKESYKEDPGAAAMNRG